MTSNNSKDKVCPRCGTPAEASVWCAPCGLNLKKQGELPTAEAYAAKEREKRWLAEQEKLTDGPSRSPRAEQGVGAPTAQPSRWSKARWFWIGLALLAAAGAITVAAWSLVDANNPAPSPSRSSAPPSSDPDEACSTDTESIDTLEGPGAVDAAEVVDTDGREGCYDDAHPMPNENWCVRTTTGDYFEVDDTAERSVSPRHRECRAGGKLDPRDPDFDFDEDTAPDGEGETDEPGQDEDATSCRSIGYEGERGGSLQVVVSRGDASCAEAERVLSTFLAGEGTSGSSTADGTRVEDWFCDGARMGQPPQCSTDEGDSIEARE